MVICRFDRTTKSFYKRCAKEETKARIPPLQAPAPMEEHRE